MKLNADTTVLNIVLLYGNLSELPTGFLHSHPFPNTFIIKNKIILSLRVKDSVIDSLSSL